MTGERAWFGWLREYPEVAWGVAAIVAIGLLLIVWLWKKGRPFAKGNVFRASRFSSGNRIFPTQVLISPTSVVHYTASWIGREEKTIHMAHVASVNIETGMLLSDVLIETSGGTHPIVCHGHHNRDATAMKQLIERYQTAYYKKGGV